MACSSEEDRACVGVPLTRESVSLSQEFSIALGFCRAGGPRERHFVALERLMSLLVSLVGREAGLVGEQRGDVVGRRPARDLPKRTVPLIRV